MDFKKAVKAEIDKKYHQMLTSTSSCPFSKPIKIESQRDYKENRDKYYLRLNKEKDEFNNARLAIQKTRDARLAKIKVFNDKKYDRKVICRIIIGIIILMMPIVIAVLVGFDIFNKLNGYIAKINSMEGIDWGWIVFFYIVFCVVALSSCIVFTIKLIHDVKGFSREEHNERFFSYMKDVEKQSNIIMAIVVVISIIIVTLNLVHIIPNWWKNKVVFEGGDVHPYQYVEKGGEVKLLTGEEYKKAQTSGNGYVSRYELTGWEINGQTYLPGDTYIPKGWDVAKAIFDENKFCRLKINAYGNTTVNFSYNGENVAVADSFDDYLPYGVEITISYHHGGTEDRYAYINDVSFESPYTFELDKHVQVRCNSRDAGCLAEGTQIMLYNGQQKAVEDLQIGDVLMVFNHETGRYDAIPLLVNVHANTEAKNYTVLNLHFSDGNELRIIEEHGLFDKELNEYVYIRFDNYNNYLGHRFVTVEYLDGVPINKEVFLIDVVVTEECIKIFNPASVWHINLVANNMLTLSAGMVNLFDYDETMKYDKELMRKDIEEYGLYTYEEFENFVSPEVFQAFPFKYYKIAIAKGKITYEELLILIDFYNDKDSIK